MRNSKILLLAIVALLVFQLAIPGFNHSAHAADANFITFKYDTFSNDGRLKTNGVTSFEAGKLRLTPASTDRWGTAFNNDRVSLKNDKSFSTYFTFQLTNGGGYDVGWADGIVFTVQTYSNSAGTAGGGMGYQGIPQSVGIEFDTWNNGDLGDPDANHIGINFNGVLKNDIVKSLDTSTLNLKSGTVHAWVDYDGVNKKIEVRVSKSDVRPTTATLSKTDVNLTSMLSSSDVYVGFTAATGGAYQNHDITKWYFVNDYAPIDSKNSTYSQAPTGYDVTQTELEDGSVKLVIKAKGGSQQNNIPINITATNGATVAPASATTDENGEAEVIITSPGGTMDSTVKVEGPSGIYQQVTAHIPGRSAAPEADRVIANVTDSQITVLGVPEHATVSIYDAAGTPIITRENVTGGSVTFSGISGLSIVEDIQVTFTEVNLKESKETKVRPKVRSEALQANELVSNGTRNIVYVSDGEAGATVRVYDHQSGLIIGQAIADGSEHPLAISIEGGLVDLQVVEVSIQQINELESTHTIVSTILDKSDKPIKAEANASTDIIKVRNVPDGAKVIIYDGDGDEIASVYNRTGVIKDMVVNLFPPGFEVGDRFEVSIIEVKKYESDKVKTVGKVQSSSLPADNIAVNGTTDKVKVSDVPVGATITVYDDHGKWLGAATNNRPSKGEVTIAIAEGLAEGQEVYVTQEENGKLESEATIGIALFEKSIALDQVQVVVNATNDTVTVTNVPAGATITVYDEEDYELGTATNTSNEAGPVVVTIGTPPGLNEGDVVKVTITEVDKSKSNPISSTAKVESASLDANDIMADGTAGTVTVADVPAGATIIVYDEHGHELGRLTQGDAEGELTLTGLTEMGDNITVSITLEGELAGEPVSQAVAYLQSAPLSTADVNVNATNDTVTVANVPAGATITVYDEEGHVIGTATNTGGEAGSVIVTLDVPGVSSGDQVKVTIRERNKTESDALEATAEYEQSTSLNTDDIIVNATNDTVTVANVPAGATITVYDEEDNELGIATNSSNEAGPVVVTIGTPLGLEKGEVVKVTITEVDKSKSDPISSTAKVESASLDANDIMADGTAGTVTVADVPAGATIIVYDEHGHELGRLTQGDAEGELTLTGLTEMGDNITVSIALEGELASEPVSQAVAYLRSAPLSTADVTVNATNDTVTVANVPAGATITVYDEEGHVIGTATNTGGEAGSVIITLDAPGIGSGDQVKVTIRERNKAESDALEVTAEYEQSTSLNADDIIVNATNDTVTVANVPAGATITVYDEEDNELGTATNSSNEAGPVVVTIGTPPGLNEGDVVKVTITEVDKSKSDPISSTAKVESTSLDVNDIKTDGTAGTVTVADVPTGATIIVYDEHGHELGRLTQGDAEGELTLTGLTEMGDNITVSIALEGELASEPVSQAVAYLRSTPLSTADVNVNATNDTVTVANVPAGATITVYDEEGHVIGTATNTGGEAGSVIITLDAPGIGSGDQVKVTIRERNKAESDALEVTAEYEQSTSLNADDIIVNATNDTVTVANVPAGATITVYDEEDNELGTVTNTSNEAGSVVVTIGTPPGLNEGDVVKVTITEVDKLKSESRVCHAMVASDSLAPNRILANATSDTVALTAIPSGAEVKVYRTNGELIGTMANNGAEAADLLILIGAPGIASGETLRVSITEAGKLASGLTTVTATLEQTVAPTPDQLVANATNDRIYIQGVPAGVTVKVYDLSGNLLMTRKNTTSSTSELILSMIPGFVAGNQFKISLAQAKKLESTKTTVTAYDQSTALSASQVKNIDVSKDTIVLKDIPAGATVIAYDTNGNEIGRSMNTSGANGDVTIIGQLTSDAITFTIIEAGKLKSEAKTIDLQLTTSEQIDDALRRLSIGFQAQDTWESVTLDVFLLTVGAHETNVAWNSSKPTVVTIANPTNGTIEATVARKDNDESVILTAVVSKNGISKSRTFLLIVKSSSLTKSENPAYRTVDVAGGEGQNYILPIYVNRITMSDGSKIDKSIFDPASAATFTNESTTKNSPARIIVNELPADQADEYAIEIPQQSVNGLAQNGNSLEILTEYGQLKISSTVLAQMNDSFLDLFFRIVSVKNQEKQDDLNDQLMKDSTVLQAAGNHKVAVLGSSLEIETNYRDYDTTLFIPFAKNGIVVPTVNVDSFLTSLRIFIEHSDGEKVVSTGSVIYEAGVPIGLAIEISKFSTFTIFQLQAPASTYIPPVTNVSESEPESSEAAHHTGYITGYEDGTFRPEQSIKRSEMAAILFRVNELKVQNSFKQLYPDVSSSHWAAAYIERLNALEWMIGDVNGNFRPNSGITRAEMAIMISRWMMLPVDNADAAPFSDVANTHWASQAIATVYKAGYMIGYEENTFRPKQYLTRAEAVTIINRVLNRGSLTNVPSPSWKDVDSNYWAYGDIEEASRDHFYVKVEGERSEQFVEHE